MSLPDSIWLSSRSCTWLRCEGRGDVRVVSGPYVISEGAFYSSTSIDLDDFEQLTLA